jgi:hypothetical protein
VTDPTITVVDGRGRTVETFVKIVRAATNEMWVGDTHFPAQPAGTEPEWHVAGRPWSEKSKRQSEIRWKKNGIDVNPRSPKRLHTVDGHRQVLELPGLTMRWEKVTPILDRLWEHGITRLTIDQLRYCIR